MLNFGSPQLSDKIWAEKLLRAQNSKSCTYSFSLIYSWAKYYDIKYARCGECLYVKFGKNYVFPAGTFNVKQAIDELLNYTEACGEQFLLYATEEQTGVLEENFPGKFVFTESRDDADYIYNHTDLSELKGKKYHAKRNHISKFCREYTLECAEITEQNIEQCTEIFNKWCEQTGDCGDKNSSDSCALKCTVKHFFELGLYGLIIYANKIPAAFCIGEPLCDDTFVIHYEKACGEFDGAYAVINREFARRIPAEYKFINREDDTGNENLRKSKLSYYPEILLKKYSVTLR